MLAIKLLIQKVPTKSPFPCQCKNIRGYIGSKMDFWWRLFVTLKFDLKKQPKQCQHSLLHRQCHLTSIWVILYESQETLKSYVMISTLSYNLSVNFEPVVSLSLFKPFALNWVPNTFKSVTVSSILAARISRHSVFYEKCQRTPGQLCINESKKWMKTYDSFLNPFHSRWFHFFTIASAFLSSPKIFLGYTSRSHRALNSTGCELWSS